MIYKVCDKSIIIKDKTEFNPKHILECGQVFRFKKTDVGYVVFSLDKIATIIEKANEITIISSDVKYFVNYFDLDNNYNDIKNKIAINSTMKEAINFGSGLRILKQDPFEMLVSFIISANNNIKRIQSIIEKLCEKVGTKIESYYAFPTKNQMLTLSVEELKKLGLGFRAKYIYNAIRQIDEQFFKIENISTKEGIEFLTKFSGVGPKVADCVLLFGFKKTDVFPVDTWIEKVYNDYFCNGKLTNRTKIREIQCNQNKFY